MPRQCSFCGKGQDEVQRLIAGGGRQPGHQLAVVYICNECVELCSSIIASKPRRGGAVVWSILSAEGRDFEWTAVPQPDGTVAVIIRPVGEEKSVGGVLPAGTDPTEERVLEVLRSLKGHL